MLLHRHPASPPSPAAAIDVVATRHSLGNLSLVFAVSGDVSRIRLPRSSTATRKDGLWRHTCFEAFVRPLDAPGYVELNLAPSGDYAAYAFDSYRHGMSPAEVEVPAIESRVAGDQLGVVAEVSLAGAKGLDGLGTWQLSLTAVIEADDGSLSHWALAHPLAVPDFHHPDCFVLELPPAGDA